MNENTTTKEIRQHAVSAGKQVEKKKRRKSRNEVSV